MATYYLDLAADYADATGDPDGDGSGDVYCGVGGLQAASRGTGSATALMAGDELRLKGHGYLGRLVKMTCGKDVSGWSLEDEVRNDTGDGDDWTGVVCELSVGANNTVILVELDSGLTVSDVDTGNGIENTTTPDTTTLSAASADGWQIDTNSGDAASGRLKIKGVSAAWVTGVGTSYCATLDGESVATNCIYINGNNYIALSNLILQAATGDGLSAAANTYYAILQYLQATNNGADGIGGDNIQYSMLLRVKADNNTAKGIRVNGSCGLAFCQSIGNGSHGFYSTTGCCFIGCLAHDNTDDNFCVTNATSIVGCVSDASNADGIYLGSVSNLLLANRITNNGGFGINGNYAGAPQTADCNVLYNNTAGHRNNCPAGPNSRIAADATECGYIDQPNDDFRLTSAAIMAGEDAAGIALDWTSATYPNTGYHTAGIPRIYDLPIAADVRSGKDYDDGYATGTCAVPVAGDVEAGVAVDTGVGTFGVPAIRDVTLSVGYGAAGMEFTGTNSRGAGPGVATVVFTLKTGGGTPIGSASVWLTTDAAGSNSVAGPLTTNDAGQATFYLDAGVTYYRFAKKTAYVFSNPQSYAVPEDPGMPETHEFTDGAVGAPTTDLITADRAAQNAQLADVGAALLASLIGAASAAIARWCGREFVAAEDTETYDGDGSDELLLDRCPIIDLGTVVLTHDDGTTTSLASTEFRANNATGLVKFKPDSTADYTHFPKGFQNVAVTYTGGWATIPSDVQEACVHTVLWLYNQGVRDQALASERLGDYQWVAANADQLIPTVAKSLLARYRVVRSGR